MSAPITARSLMKTAFRTIEPDCSLREALQQLMGESPEPTIVVHADGSLAGLLTPTAFYRALLRKIRLDEMQTLTEAELLAAAGDQLGMRVSDAMVRDVPRAYPDDRLSTLMKINTENREQRVEFTPVLENDAVIGIVYITEIFHAAASLALTPDTAGIQLDSEKDDEISH